MRWYRLAAEQGNANAQLLLGTKYGQGQGVTQDYILAHMWTNLAAARKPPGKKRDLTTEARDIFEKLMTPAQVAEAQRLARKARDIYEKLMTPAQVAEAQRLAREWRPK